MSGGLSGRRVLIVEDDSLLADDLARDFGKAGIHVVGPTSSLAQALAMVEADGIEGAVLDINLSEHLAYPVADALLERGVLIVFVSGYDKEVVPVFFADVPFCQKPVSSETLMKALERASG